MRLLLFERNLLLLLDVLLGSISVRLTLLTSARIHYILTIPWCCICSHIIHLLLSPLHTFAQHIGWDNAAKGCVCHFEEVAHRRNGWEVARHGAIFCLSHTAGSVRIPWIRFACICLVQLQVFDRWGDKAGTLWIRWPWSMTFLWNILHCACHWEMRVQCSRKASMLFVCTQGDTRFRESLVFIECESLLVIEISFAWVRLYYFLACFFQSDILLLDLCFIF